MPFNIIIKPSGAKCNLKCDYCFYLAKESLYPNSSFEMSDKVLESLVRQYIENQKASEIHCFGKAWKISWIKTLFPPLSKCFLKMSLGLQLMKTQKQRLR